MLAQAQIEKTEVGFDRAKLLAAREKTLEAIRQIVATIHPGMHEEDAYELSRSILKDMGARKNWHRPWIRFGPNTLKPYNVISQPKQRLGDDDIFFIDIGPVWDGYEGDGGDTFVTGGNELMRRCKEDVKKIFNLVKNRWQEDRWNGERLYQFAEATTRKLGWELNWRANGHRLSDFPHAVYFKGGLSEISYPPSPFAWVLEIQIRHPKESFGAFFEDLIF